MRGHKSGHRAPFVGRTLSASAALWVAATGTLAALAGACHEVVAKYGGPPPPPLPEDGGTRPVATRPVDTAPTTTAPDAGQRRTTDAGTPPPAPDGSAAPDPGASATTAGGHLVSPRSLPDAGHRPPKVPPRVRMGATTVMYGGRLPPEVVKRIVGHQQPTFRKCYGDALAKVPELAGRIVVKFVIHRDGRVGNVQASSEPSSLDPSMVGCITKAFWAMTFPQPEGGLVTVTYPMVFKP